MPKFGEWDVNDPASAEGFTVIFNKARDEKRTGEKADSPPKDGSRYKHKTSPGKPQPVRHKPLSWLKCLSNFNMLPCFSFSSNYTYIYMIMSDINILC